MNIKSAIKAPGRLALLHSDERQCSSYVSYGQEADFDCGREEEAQHSQGKARHKAQGGEVEHQIKQAATFKSPYNPLQYHGFPSKQKSESQ